MRKFVKEVKEKWNEYLKFVDKYNHSMFHGSFVHN